jgi:CRISPR system Cascade subunit CasE
MYLSRLMLNPRHRKVQRDLADPYQLHRTVLSGFPTGGVHLQRATPDAAGVLYRVDDDRGRLMLLVQSQQPPDWGSLPEDYLLPADPFDPVGDNPAVKPFDPHFQPGQRLAFRLRANPTKRLGKSAERDVGKRVGIYDADKQVAWMERKAAAAGFRLLTLTIGGDDTQKGVIPQEAGPALKLQLLAVRFDGILQVTDPSAFSAALTGGIGSGKAWGCGLLSLAPARG